MPVLQQRTVPPQRTLRRSSRIPVQVPIHVTSLEPEARFSEVCETLVVNAHGCALRLPIPLNAGSPLHLHSREGRQATAYVVACEPLGSDGEGWRLGARLDRPENFWGLKACPDDWRVLEMPSPAALQGAAKLAPEALVVKKPQASRPSQAFLDKIEEQLSEERLLGILGKLVRPLQAEVNEIREKLARQARQNRFEVSLGQIPPELERETMGAIAAGGRGAGSGAGTGTVGGDSDSVEGRERTKDWCGVNRVSAPALG